jgi:hypothetical protein
MPRKVTSVGKAAVSPSVKQRRAPAKTAEGRESQLTSLAYDQAEAELLEKKASSQTLHHFLVQGSTKHKLEKEKLERENELLKAKVEALKSAQSQDELYEKAINAMRRYNGSSEEDYEH